MKRPFLKLLFIVGALVAGLHLMSRQRNPYAEVEWVEEWPGAGDRYRTFTPVLKTDHKIAVGPTIGADYGALFFEDIDNDGVKEAIIESDGFFTFEEFYSERHALQYQRDSLGRPKFTEIKSEELP